ncbi:RNA polymerase sigma factor [Streptomyces olivaceoviridis]|uniref:RNA polymerase sigma factor n=1 Tax=Streptomyces olivaceoviridis TaxID=1921 RepID=UPI0036AA4A54
MELSLRARIRAGDAHAFTQLFREHAQAVHAHAARWLGDPAAAEDVVSLTFLEAWRLRDRLLSDAEFAAHDASEDCAVDGLRAWLFGIATNVLRNTRRATRRHRAALERLPGRQTDLEVIPDFSEALVSGLDDLERLAAARRALSHLRPREREVFALCVWSELSYAAAAEALNVPASTVRSRLAEARKRLRRLTTAELSRRPSQPQRPPTEERHRRPGGTGQETDDRTTAARSMQEKHR